MLEFWDPSYRCFCSKEWDLTSTLEEYFVVLNLLFTEFQLKMFMWTSRKPERYLCKLLCLNSTIVNKATTRNRNWKCGSKDMFMSFIRRHIREQQGFKALYCWFMVWRYCQQLKDSINLGVVYFFERVRNGGIQLVPSILAETFWSLNYCRENLVGSLYACPQCRHVIFP